MKPEDKEDRRNCPVPNCGKTFIFEQGALPLCPFHKQLTLDMGWILANIKFARKVPRSGLALPNSKEAKDILA